MHSNFTICTTVNYAFEKQMTTSLARYADKNEGGSLVHFWETNSSMNFSKGVGHMIQIGAFLAVPYSLNCEIIIYQWLRHTTKNMQLPNMLQNFELKQSHVVSWAEYTWERVEKKMAVSNVQRSTLAYLLTYSTYSSRMCPIIGLNRCLRPK